MKVIDLPVLSREGFPDLDLAMADEDIHDILLTLDALSTGPGDVHEEISDRLADILGGLMAHAAALHGDLVALKRAMH